MFGFSQSRVARFSLLYASTQHCRLSGMTELNKTQDGQSNFNTDIIQPAVCAHYKALKFENGTSYYGMCWINGKVKSPDLISPTEPLSILVPDATATVFLSIFY